MKHRFEHNIEILGSISSTGLVNGRNMSTDGTSLDTHIANNALHRTINDSGTATTDLWSASKINSLLGSTDFDGYYNPASETTVLTTPTDVPINTVDINDSFTHSTNSSEVTIPTTGRYSIDARCTPYVISGTSRTQCQMKLVINTGSGYNDIPGTIASMYCRTASEGEDTGNVHKKINLSAGDKIKIQITKISGSSNINLLPLGSSLTISKI